MDEKGGERSREEAEGERMRRVGGRGEVERRRRERRE